MNKPKPPKSTKNQSSIKLRQLPTITINYTPKISNNKIVTDSIQPACKLNSDKNSEILNKTTEFMLNVVDYDVFENIEIESANDLSDYDGRFNRTINDSNSLQSNNINVTTKKSSKKFINSSFNDCHENNQQIFKKTYSDIYNNQEIVIEQNESYLDTKNDFDFKYNPNMKSTLKDSQLSQKQSTSANIRDSTSLSKKSLKLSLQKLKIRNINDNNSPKRKLEDKLIGIRTNYGNQRNKTISPWSLKNFDRITPKSVQNKDNNKQSHQNYQQKDPRNINNNSNLNKPKQFTESNLYETQLNAIKKSKNYNGNDRDIMKLVGKRHGFNNLSALKLNVKKINPNENQSNSNIVSVLDDLVLDDQIGNNDSLFVEDLKDDQNYKFEGNQNFKFTDQDNDLKFNNKCELIENNLINEHNDDDFFNKEKIDMLEDEISDDLSVKIIEKKNSKKKIQVELKKDNNNKEKKIVKVIKKENIKENKPPKPKPKEPVVEEKYVERLDFKDLIVEKKGDVNSILIKPKIIAEKEIIVEKFIQLKYQYNQSYVNQEQQINQKNINNYNENFEQIKNYKKCTNTQMQQENSIQPNLIFDIFKKYKQLSYFKTNNFTIEQLNDHKKTFLLPKSSKFYLKINQIVCFTKLDKQTGKNKLSSQELYSNTMHRLYRVSFDDIMSISYIHYFRHRSGLFSRMDNSHVVYQYVLWKMWRKDNKLDPLMGSTDVEISNCPSNGDSVDEPFQKHMFNSTKAHRIYQQPDFRTELQFRLQLTQEG